MNEHSSRSHSIFMIQVTQKDMENQKKLCGKLYLVDLAGSEKVGKTGVEGIGLEQAKAINKSLSALGNVIAALASDKKSHVPYRDSKLTRILQESLGGNSRTTIVICCSPASFNEAETRSTLEFGKRAKTIKNVVSVNENLTAEKWKEKYLIENEKNMKLQDELRKWRNGETVAKNEQSNFESEERYDSPNTNRKPHQSESRSFQVEDFYKMLDKKDDEIEKQSEMIEKLKEEILQKEILLCATKLEGETSTSKAARDNKSTEAEVQEVLNAFDELANEYEMKIQECKENLAMQKKDHSEVMQSLLMEVIDIETITFDNQMEIRKYKDEKKKISDFLKGMINDIEDFKIEKEENRHVQITDILSKLKAQTEVYTKEDNQISASSKEEKSVIPTPSPRKHVGKINSKSKIDELEKAVAQDMNDLNLEKQDNLNITMTKLLLSKVRRISSQTEDISVDMECKNMETQKSTGLLEYECNEALIEQNRKIENLENSFGSINNENSSLKSEISKLKMRLLASLARVKVWQFHIFNSIY